MGPVCPGESYYREALERQLNPWLAKMYGFHLLKIGNLSAEINCRSVRGLPSGERFCCRECPIQVQSRPAVIFLSPPNPWMPVYWRIHLPWCSDPHRLLREADRVLIDDGWLVIDWLQSHEPNGITQTCAGICEKPSPYNSRMFTLMRQLDWLSLLNFEVLHASRFHVLPWNKHGGKLLNAHIPALGCLQLIVARKRTIPLTLNPMKQSKNKPRIRQAVGATRQCRKPQA